MPVPLDAACLTLRLAVGWTASCQVDQFSRHMVIPGSEPVLRELLLSLQAALQTVLLLRLLLLLCGITSGLWALVSSGRAEPVLWVVSLGAFLATVSVALGAALVGFLDPVSAANRRLASFRSRLSPWYQVHEATVSQDTDQVAILPLGPCHFTLALEIADLHTEETMISKYLEFVKTDPRLRAADSTDEFGLLRTLEGPPPHPGDPPHPFSLCLGQWPPTPEVALDSFNEFERNERSQRNRVWETNPGAPRLLSSQLTHNECEAYLEALAQESYMLKTDSGQWEVQGLDDVFRFVVDMVDGRQKPACGGWDEATGAEGLPSSNRSAGRPSPKYQDS